MRTIVARKDKVSIKQMDKNLFMANIDGEKFIITKRAVSKFNDIRASVVKFLVDSNETIIQTVSLDYEPLDNIKVAGAIASLFGDDVIYSEYIVNDLTLWIRGYFKGIDISSGVKLAFRFFNQNDGHHAFKAAFGIYTITCYNLAMFFEEASVVRLVHTWDEIKYYDPLGIISHMVDRAKHRVKRILDSAPVLSYKKETVDKFIEYLIYKRLMTRYGAKAFYKYVDKFYEGEYTNRLIFDALTYVTSNVYYLRNRLDLIDRVDPIAFGVLTKPEIVNEWVKKYDKIMGKLE